MTVYDHITTERQSLIKRIINTNKQKLNPTQNTFPIANL